MRTFLIILLLVVSSFGQLTVFEKNPNYLAYNGEPVFLLTVNPNGSWLVDRFSLDFINTVVQYGGNHIWLMLDNMGSVPYTYTRNTPQKFWDKLEAIVSAAAEHNIIVGISLFGYGHVKYPYSFSFNKVCKYCSGDVGPLETFQAMDFFRPYNQQPEVVEIRQVQMAIMRGVVNATWQYPNVYYSYGWELNTLWNQDLVDWCKWVREFMTAVGANVSPIQHLFALERSVTLDEAHKIGVDFVVEEDGNAYKTQGIPFVYFSTDGIYRAVGKPLWNSDELEPKTNIEWMRDCIVETVSAGTASIWYSDPVELVYTRHLSNFFKTVENFCDEPGNEITDEALPNVNTGSFIDITGGPCSDADTVIESNEFIVYDINPGHYRIDSVQVGDRYFVDRSYTVTSIPESLRDLQWILTANNDKSISWDEFLKFRVTRDCEVFVGYQVGILIPNWLLNFADTGYEIKTTDKNYRIYRKIFEKGRIALGGNAAYMTSQSMYIVLLREFVDPEYLINPENIIYKVEIAQIDTCEVKKTMQFHNKKPIAIKFFAPVKLVNEGGTPVDFENEVVYSRIYRGVADTKEVQILFELPSITGPGYYALIVYAGHESFNMGEVWNDPYILKFRIKEIYGTVEKIINPEVAF